MSSAVASRTETLPPGVTRRGALASLLTLGAATLLSCAGRRRRGQPGPPLGEPRTRAHRDGRLVLQARPGQPPEASPSLGLQRLGVGDGRDGLLFVPAGYRPERPAPLVVMLHGAGGDAGGALAPFVDRADDAGLVLVAPESRGRTWDILEGDYGADVAFIGRAVDHVLRRCAVDLGRMAVEGFSDGASYALGLGTANGDLFGHVVAFSPGFLPFGRRVGRPRVFVSHGVVDRVLPIDRCSRRIVPQLRRDDYDVRYEEVPEGHVVPPAIAAEAVAWLGSPR